MTVLKQLRSIWLTSGAVIALATGLVPVAAAAQASPDRIDAIEQHIRRLEGELQAMKRLARCSGETFCANPLR